MSHEWNVGTRRRDVQYVRKAIFNTEGSLTPLYQALMHYIWLAYPREMDLNILDTVF